MPHQLAADGEVENGLAQVLDLLDPGCQCGKGIDGKARVRTKRWNVCVSCAQTSQTSLCQPVAGVLAYGAGFLQPVAEGHKLIDLGDDAVLLR